MTPNELKPGKALLIRSSRRHLLVVFAMCVPIWICIQYLVFSLSGGRDYIWLGTLVALLLTSVGVYLSSRFTGLRYDGSTLSRLTLFSNQSVDLTSLQKAEKIFLLGGGYRLWMLRLEDSATNTLQFSPDWFSAQNLETIYEVLRPYIFITRVEKNFIRLEFDDRY